MVPLTKSLFSFGLSFSFNKPENIKHSEFCFPETLNASRGEAEGNIEVEGKQNSLFPAGPVIKCFVIPPNSKKEKNCKEIVCLMQAGSQICSGFKEHDLITYESKVQVVVSLGS